MAVIDVLVWQEWEDKRGTKFRLRLALWPVELLETYKHEYGGTYVRRCGHKIGWIVELKTFFDGWKAFAKYQIGAGEWP